MPSPDRRARRGPARLPLADRRDHCVSVRLNAAELVQLDERRGAMPRGEWLRVVALDQMPRSTRPVVPPVNAAAWGELARVAANLNQAQRAVNEGQAGGYPAGLFEDLAERVAELRRLLVGIDPGGTP